VINSKIVYPQAAQRVAFRQFFMAEAIARILFSLVVFYPYPLAGVAGCIGSSVSLLLGRSSSRASMDTLIAFFGLNWTVFLIVLNCLFGWQAGFYLFGLFKKNRGLILARVVFQANDIEILPVR